MSENLIVTATSKEAKYQELLPQIKALIDGEKNQIANLANVSAALHQAMGFFWVGFYLVDSTNSGELVLGPFQGPIACTRIAKGKGVCGKSWEDAEVIVVEDVDEFPGHIACSSASRSEIVVPGFKEGKVAMVLDVDSDQLSAFDQVDAQYLKMLMEIIEKNN